MKRTAVLNVVGLTAPLLERMPKLRAFAASAHVRSINPAFPAVTCTAQSTYLTGLPAAEHGIVGNGWYDRDLAEVQFWKQSNHLVHGRKLWEELRETNADLHLCQAFLVVQHVFHGGLLNYSTAHVSRRWAQSSLTFTLRLSTSGPKSKRTWENFHFAISGDQPPVSRHPVGSRNPQNGLKNDIARTLNLIYLPHLDYNLQKLGPNHNDIATDLEQLDLLLDDLITFLKQRDIQIAILSEYGITEVDRPFI